MKKLYQYGANREDGTFWELRDFLNAFEGQDLRWSILEFDGVGEAPDDAAMDDFTETVSSLPQGLPIDWPRLLDLSVQIEQTYDCLIVGATRRGCINRDELQNGRYDGAGAVIECVDASYWHVWAPEGFNPQ